MATPSTSGVGVPISAGSNSDRGSVCSMSADETDSNETDELKMARSSELHASSSARSSYPSLHVPLTTATTQVPPSNKFEDLYMKKGWLIKQGPSEKESKKHWFVLAGNSLCYYQDAKSEEASMLDGRIDLSSCYEVSEIPTHRNYGFKIKTSNGEYTLAAMTLGIRNNWMKAIRLCMELHNSDGRNRSRIGATPLPYTKSPPRASLDDLEFKSGAASSSTAAVKYAGGETAFQLVGNTRDESGSRGRARRHHSDVNPGNVSSVLSVCEFSTNIDSAEPFVPPSSSNRSTRSLDTPAKASDRGSDLSLTPRASKMARHHSPSTSSDSLAWSSLDQHKVTNIGGERDHSGSPVASSNLVSEQGNLSATAASSSGGSTGSGTSASNRGITSESPKEDVKREMMRRAKSPSARVRDKTRAAKSPRLHSSGMQADKGFSSGYHQSHHLHQQLHPMAGSAQACDSGSAMSDNPEDFAYADVPMSEEETDLDEVGSATASDVVGGSDEALVEMLETEVETLKDRLEHTQTELDQVQKDNLDLKTRLRKETTQSVDSGYSPSSRWGQPTDSSAGRYVQTSTGVETQSLKRQLKDSQDTVQRQKMDIEGLKSKLDMSLSKLTGTEKALSEALRDYKQEKDKFLKLSSEWNRRLRAMEGQHKDTVHKLELSRESLQAKERECRRLEAEVKANSQKTREQEREILKLKAVEHEYKQLKEKLDDRDHEVSNLKAQLKEKEQWGLKQQEEHAHEMQVLHQDFQLERDDLEAHLDQLKTELYSAHDRQVSLSDNMTQNMADMLRDKDDIIAQLEEKMIEADKKMVDMSEELHAEMGENADLSHTISTLRQDKQSLTATIGQLEQQLISLQGQVAAFESDRNSLHRQLDELRMENTQLHDGLVKAGEEQGDVSFSPTLSAKSSGPGNVQEEKLKKTIVDLNNQIQKLQHQLKHADPVTVEKIQQAERFSSVGSSGSSFVGGPEDNLSVSMDHQQDLLHVVLVVDSQLKEVNMMLLTLRQSFDAYLEAFSNSDQSRAQGNKLAELIEDIGHRCRYAQDTLREDPEEGPIPEYKHAITVGPASGGAAIMREYKGLKVKFDQAVAEVRKLRRDVREAQTTSESIRGEDKKLKEMLSVMEGAYKQQIVELIARVDSLAAKVVNVQTETHPSPPTSPLDSNPLQQIEQQLNELEGRISSIEQQVQSQHQQNRVDDTAIDTVVELDNVRSQLEGVNSKLRSLNYPTSMSGVSSADLVSKAESCKQRLGNLTASMVPSQGNKSSADSTAETSAASAAVADCLNDIRDMVREIGEQLDSLDEDDEDSDSEDEEEQTPVEDIREKLSNLAEFIEEHSKLSTSDWALMRLLTLQKSNLSPVKESKESRDSSASDSVEGRLKTYSSRISLEAVLLYEMAHILQTKNYLTPEDCVCREIDSLNTQLTSLHQKLNEETKTMHFQESQADLLSAYTELMAEKILINGQIFADTHDQRSPLGKVAVEASPAVQPVVLATEALVRSQIDSFISSNMGSSVSEIMSMPSYLSVRAAVQGELTHAMAQLKSRLKQQPDILRPGPANYKFCFERLLTRQRKVFASLKDYEKQVTNALAVIIYKESEEMTIVEGPESVLESMCSDLSTIMETHIQLFKEKCRSSLDTHSARKFDLIVNELRQCREETIQAIKSHHEDYVRDQTSVRDSSLDIPVQSLDNTIASLGEILSLKAVVAASISFMQELLQMGSVVLADLDFQQESVTPPEGTPSAEKGLNFFINNLTEVLEAEALSKSNLSSKLHSLSSLKNQSSQMNNRNSCSEESAEMISTSPEDLRIPQLSLCLDGDLTPEAQVLVREAVFSAQLTVSLFKQKLLHDCEMQQLKKNQPLRAARACRDRPKRSGGGTNEEEQGMDSDDTLDLQNDFQALLLPLEEVLENKHEDELEVLQILVSHVKQILSEKTSASSSGHKEDQLRLLEQKLQHELVVARERHATHLEVFRQESARLEKTLEDQASERDDYEDRAAQLAEELSTLQLQHEEEKERVKQDILTAVHAIRSNEEKSETSQAQKASKLGRELAVQKLNFRKMLGSIKTDLATKDKNTVVQTIEDHIKGISLNPDEEEDEDYQPPLPLQPPPAVPADSKQQNLEQVVEDSEPEIMLNMSHHEHEVEQLKKEKDEALAEEMRNTKAALDAVRSAYEDELTKERAKYKEALLTMYTEEYINEIRMRHQEEEDRMREELQKVNMHYTSKCEDYKLMEMKLQQVKHDYDGHINQLIASNDHLESMLNTEIESLKEFIKNKPSSASLTTGSATMEEELYDSKIMVRVKDAELQKLRSQVKNLENSLHRTTEEQRQTMTQYMQALKKSSELKTHYEEEVAQLTDKLHKVLGSQGLKANLRRTPSFHQRARSPSPQGVGGTSPRKESMTDHSSRDSHRRRHIQPKDLRRSKSSPSLPYVFDGTTSSSPSKLTAAKPGRRSRSPKT